MLHLCAVTSLQYVKELRDYYDKKVGEGKHKMSVINAIRNKLVLRVFAVVKKGVPFVNKYETAA